MNEFFVDKFRVDMGRSQIIAQDAIVSMEPKVLQVLLILAENQGQVVSHQDILNKVWPDVQVAPNALQRCVAQLRKAFNDDAKSQKVIATHPKIGYSLIANVNWQGQLSQSRGGEPIQQKNSNSWRWGFVALSMSFVLLLLYVMNPSTNGLPLTHLNALTTTDKKEFSPTFSPDGQTIAFQRYVGQCKNQLWALDLKDNKEYLITKEAGIYGTPSWSPDSSQLAFSSVTRCGQERELRGCKDIQTISFALAKSSPQTTRQLLRCDKQEYSAVVWLSNEKLAFFASEGEQTQLMSMSLTHSDITKGPQAPPSVETLYEFSDYRPYSLAYSGHLNQLAIMQHNPARDSSMLLLNPDDGAIEQVELDIPEEFNSHIYWNANWHPQKNNLISATGSSFFEIELNGKMVEYPIPTFQGLHDPYVHPDGSRIIAAMGTYDMDIGSLQWQLDPDNATKKEQFTFSTEIIHRSILPERNAQYQPNGEQIAFISRRSGSNQIWLAPQSVDNQTGENQALQLSHLLADKSDVKTFIWSIDGKFIIYIARRALQLLNLDGQTHTLSTPFKVLDIYQRLAGERLLLSVIHEKKVKIISFDINSGEYQELYVGSNKWAQLTHDEVLYVTNEKNLLGQVINGEIQDVKGLEGVKSWARFYYRDDQLVILDDDNKLWLYDTKSQIKSLLLEAKDSFKLISDIDLDNHRLLFSKGISAKKEIVMFYE